MSKLLSNLNLSQDQIMMASLPSDLPDSFFCPPPVVNTEPIQGLAALVDSGQAGDIVLFRPYPLALQIKKPEGFWASACGCRFGLQFMRRVQGLRSSS